ncbi:hypothetical protein H4Q26_012412 [Puccinia striiformis f. sp. tritici PST-130]|nr:hypothetical protein H4Q26_012412 [Puccinia striiformis f. sp. tritici PST-130]
MIRIPKGVRSPTGVNVRPKYCKMSDEKLTNHIKKVSLKRYNQAAKQLGYIPLWFDDPTYITEREREKSAGFTECRCSVCLPVEASAIIKNLVFATKENFDQIVADEFEAPFSASLKHKHPVKRAGTRKRKFNEVDTARLDVFKEELVEGLASYYNEQDTSGGDVEAGDFFGTKQADFLAINLHKIESVSDIRKHIGGECFDGQMEWLMDAISVYKITQEGNPSTHGASKLAPKKHRSIVIETTPHTQPVIPHEPTTQPDAPLVPLLSKKARADVTRELKRIARVEADQRAQARKEQLAAFQRESKERYNLLI